MEKRKKRDRIIKYHPDVPEDKKLTRADIQRLIRTRMVCLEVELEKFKKRFPQLWKTRNKK